MSNERTTPDIASLAAQIMTMDNAELVRRAYTDPDMFRSVAASAMKQAEDRTFETEAPKAKRAVRQPKP